MLSIIYQYCIQNEKKAGKRSAEQCVWHPPCSSESLLQTVQGRTSLSVCTVISHSNMQAVLKRRGISFMAWAPDHTEKDHIQFIQGTLLDKNVQLRHIYIYIYIYVYILLPRSAKILGYSVMVLSWLVGRIFFVLFILTLLLQHNEIFKCSLCHKLNFQEERLKG